LFFAVYLYVAHFMGVLLNLLCFHELRFCIIGISITLFCSNGLLFIVFIEQRIEEALCWCHPPEHKASAIILDLHPSWQTSF